MAATSSVTVAATQFACGPETAVNVDRAERVVRVLEETGLNRGW